MTAMTLCRVIKTDFTSPHEHLCVPLSVSVINLCPNESHRNSCLVLVSRQVSPCDSSEFVLVAIRTPLPWKFIRWTVNLAPIVNLYPLALIH
jgi:hypothetical protein